MNFLSHFYFDRKSNIFYNLGLVFPDLYRNFTNKKLILNISYNHDFWQGCQQHIERDKIFHNSIFFEKLTKFISKNLDHQVNYERKWFLNHILLEIALDRYLIDKNPQLADDFYKNLNLVNLSEIIEILSPINQFDENIFQNRFNQFVKNKYIYTYKDNNKISYALQRIFERAGIKSEQVLHNENKLIEFIPALLEKIDMEIIHIE